MRNSVILGGLKRILVSVLIVAMLINPAFADTFVINSGDETADALPGDGVCDDGGGNCTLRAALEETNLLGVGGHTITLGGDFTSQPLSAMPTIINDGLFIDFNNGNTYRLDGINTGGIGNGLTIAADNVTVHGINIYGIGGGHGIEVQSTADGTEIKDTVIGLDASGSVNPVSGAGVYVQGTNTLIDSNVLSGNALGLSLTGGVKDVTITNNKIGTNATGDVVKPNGAGIWIDTIGTDVNVTGVQNVGIQIGNASGGNVISGNSGEGILMQHLSNTVAGDITVQNNKIGVAADGVTAMANGTNGFNFTGTGQVTANVIIGSDEDSVNDASEGNVILHSVNIEDAGTLLVSGNKVGVDSTGTVAIAGGTGGMTLDGDTVEVNNNVIGNQTGAALTVRGTDATSVSVTGNMIGVDVNGANDFSNGGGAIIIDTSNAATVTVGGAGADRNVVGNNAATAIDIQNISSTGALNIYNNYVGVEADGSTAAPNLSTGIGIGTGVDGTSVVNIGGNGLGNIVSNNSGLGINIEGGQTVTMQGNIIGAASDGVTPAGNFTHGVFVSSTITTSLIVGGATAALGNVIVDSGNDGFYIASLASSAATALFKGNYIGIAADGQTTTGLGNTQNGINIFSGAITIGGENSLGAGGTGALGEGNVISNNGSAGVQIGGVGVTALNFFGNIVGLKKGAGGVYDTAAGNYSGLIVDSGSTNLSTINIGAADGATVTSKRNIISASDTSVGVSISADDPAGVYTVENNYIGTDYLGVADLGNADNGLKFESTATTIVNVGGTGVSEGNLVSGNSGHGISLRNGIITVLGNIVGLNVTGTAALPNVGIGLVIDGVNSEAIIGDGTSNGRNLISGNAAAGIEPDGFETMKIQNNYIGTDITGTVAFGNGATAALPSINYGGILVSNTAGLPLVIGSDGDGVNDSNEGNVISGNYGQGILIVSGSGTKIAGNIIGLDASGTAALPNVAGSQTYDIFGNGETTSESPTKVNGAGILLIDYSGAVISDFEIGDDTDSTLGNIIAGNVGAGIVLGIATTVFTGGGQDWTSGYIKNNKFGVLADGVTEMPNGGYNLYVNDQGGALTNFSVGGSQNIFNNSTGGDVGITLVDVVDSELATGSKLTDLVGNNTFTDTATGPANNYWEQYLSNTLTDWLPKYACSDGEDNDADGETDYPTDDGCSSATDNDETDPAPVVSTPAPTSGTPALLTTRSTTTSTRTEIAGTTEVTTDTVTKTVDPTKSTIDTKLSNPAAVNGATEDAKNVVKNIKQVSKTVDVLDAAVEEVTREFTVVSVKETKAVQAYLESSLLESVLSEELEVQERVVSEEAKEVQNVFEKLANDGEIVDDVREYISENVIDSIDKSFSSDVEGKVIVSTGGVEEDIRGGEFKVAFSAQEAEEMRAANPGVRVITPSTVNQYGVAVMYSIAYGLNPFDFDSNGNGVPNTTELFVHRYPDTEEDLSEIIKEKKIITNLDDFNRKPVLFTNNGVNNRISINVVGDDGAYEAVIAKVVEKDEVAKAEAREKGELEFDLEEVERGEGEIVKNKDVYTIDQYLEDGRYYFLITRKVEDGEDQEEIFVSEFEVVSNKLLESSDVDLSKSVVVGEDGVEEELILIKGKVSKPGAKVFISFQSVVLNSVVIADANGEYQVAVPRNLPGGEHNVVVYAYDEDSALKRGIMSNISRLVFTK